LAVNGIIKTLLSLSRDTQGSTQQEEKERYCSANFSLDGQKKTKRNKTKQYSTLHSTPFCPPHVKKMSKTHGTPTEGMECYATMEDITEEDGNYGTLL
jgi:hypothetical protein